MHEAALSRAALPAPVRIYGIELRPYALGHELFLIRENNPLAVGGNPLPGDLFEAVWICSSTFKECTEARSSLFYIPKLWLLKRRAKKYNFEKEAEAFRQYREDGSLEFPISEIPRPNRDSGPTRPPGSPFLLRLHQFVMERLQKSELEAWDYPVGLAKMRWAAHWEQKNGLDVYNAQDAQFDAFIAEQEAKGAKQCRA